MTTPSSNALASSAFQVSNTDAALIWGYKWDGTSSKAVTWSIPTTANYAAASIYGGAGETNTFHAFNAIEAAAAQQCLKTWDRIAGLNLIQIKDTASSVGEIRFGLTDANDSPGLAGYTYSPGSTPSAGDVWMEFHGWHMDRASAITPGSSDYMTLLHEVGHALGLKHPFDKTSTNAATLPAAKDNYFYTIMSYSSKPDANPNADFYPTTPMYLDMRALQTLYGADKTTNAGNTTYHFTSAQQYWQTIYDAGGRDKISYSGNADCIIDLNEGHFSSLGAPIHFTDGTSTRATVCIGPHTTIEAASGGNGNDSLIGNTANNMLNAGGGVDKLLGGKGNDVLNGGAGNDIMTGGAGHDVFVFDTKLGVAGIDQISDFRPGDDTIRLSHAIFSSLGKPGYLNGGEFYIGYEAHDASDHIIYNAATGGVFYDPDGRGGAAQVEFALLHKHLALKASDFIIS